ncbi:MAG: helix-turn-helix domain-containing protein [Gammaproteobacteria bacterium]
MNQFHNQLRGVLSLLDSIERDLKVNDLTPNEKQVLYTVAKTQKQEANISDIVNSSGLSRSSVYKTLKKLIDADVVALIQSDHDKREFLVKLS